MNISVLLNIIYSWIIQHYMNLNQYYIPHTGLLVLVGKEFANSLGDLGFNPRLRHNKNIKNGTWYLLA